MSSSETSYTLLPNFLLDILGSGVRSIIFLIISLVLTVSGVYFFSYGLLWVAHDYQSENWPTVQGEIISSEVYTQIEITRDNSDDRKSETDHKPTVIYRYKVKNKVYKNNQIAMSKSSGEKDWAKQKVKQYPEGSSVKVFYKPDNPERAVLEPGITSGGPLMSFLGLGQSFIGSFLLWIIYRRVASDSGETEEIEEGKSEQRAVEPEGYEAVIESNISQFSIGQWVFLWGIVGGWNIISILTFYFGIGDMIDEGKYLVAVIITLFFLAGLAMIGGMIYLVLRKRKFGPSYLYLPEQTPIPLGSTMTGKIQIPRSVHTEGTDVLISLTCVHRERDHDTEDGTMQSETVWEDKTTRSTNELDMEKGQPFVPFDFKIPFDAGDTSRGEVDDWTLSVESAMPGIDYSADFDLPVKKTADSNSQLTTDSLKN